ncbi:hypothetical protein ACW7N6_38430 [Streptomyces sp. UC1A3]
MSQDAKTRALIEDAVAAATASLAARLEALEGRLSAVEGDGGAPAATAQKRPSAGRTARVKEAPAEKAGTGQ